MDSEARLLTVEDCVTLLHCVYTQVLIQLCVASHNTTVISPNTTTACMHSCIHPNSMLKNPAMFEKSKSPPGSESPLGGSRRGSVSPGGASQLQLPQKPVPDELLEARTHLRAVSKDGSSSGGLSSLEGLLEVQYDSDDSKSDSSVVRM
jgi:hypothetical protein